MRSRSLGACTPPSRRGSPAEVASRGASERLRGKEGAETRRLQQVAAGGTVNGCPYYNLCLFTGKNFTGKMQQMKSCTNQPVRDYFQSWVNNQTPGTKAVFLGEECLLRAVRCGSLSTRAVGGTASQAARADLEDRFRDAPPP